MAAILRNAKTFLEMELDGKNVFTRIISRKRIGKNHFMRCLRISVETAMGCVQVKVIQDFFFFFFLPEQGMQVGVRAELLRPIEERQNASTRKPPY